MKKEELKAKIAELDEMIFMADEVGNDHHERKEMRNLFDEIKKPLLVLLEDAQHFTKDDIAQAFQAGARFGAKYQGGGIASVKDLHETAKARRDYLGSLENDRSKLECNHQYNCVNGYWACSKCGHMYTVIDGKKQDIAIFEENEIVEVPPNNIHTMSYNKAYVLVDSPNYLSKDGTTKRAVKLDSKSWNAEYAAPIDDLKACPNCGKYNIEVSESDLNDWFCRDCDTYFD